MTDDPRHRIAARAARELRPGEVVNLGIGIPNLIPRYLDADADIFVHTENGLPGPELAGRAGSDPVARVVGHPRSTSRST